MSSPYISPVQDVAVRTCAASWHEANAARYIFSKLPTVRVKGPRSMHSGITTYNVAALDNFLLKAGEGRAWLPGQNLRPARAIGESEITIRLASEANAPTPFPLPRDAGPIRLADAENATAEHMALLYSRRDQVVYNLLKNDSVFGDGSGGQLSWTGTNPIDEESGGATAQDIIADIDNQLDALRYWKQAGNLDLVCIMDRKHATVLARKPAYHGAGTGSNSASRLSDGAFRDIFAGTHGFDDVMIMDLPADTVREGQTSAPSYIAGTPFLWLGLIARGSYDLTSDTSRGPDGAFAFAEEFSPFVDRIEEPKIEVVSYVGKDALNAFAVRGGTMGRCFTGNFS